MGPAIAAHALAVLFGLPGGARARWAIPGDVETVPIIGYRLAYREAGSGAPIVPVHGSLGDDRIWYAEAPTVSKDYRVLSLGPRRSYPERWNGVGGDFAIARHVADGAALIRRLGRGPVHLLGHSRGGAAVLAVARGISS